MDDAPGRKHVSYSQLQMLEGCPEQHRQKYVLGKTEPFSYEVLIGQASHKLPEACLGDLQEGRPIRTRSAALDVVAEYWQEHESEYSFKYRFSGAHVSKDKCLSDAISIARTMYDELLPAVSKGTWKSEQEFLIPIPGEDGWDFKGAIDHLRVTNGSIEVPPFSITVDDWKTTGKMWADSRADGSIQATAYCWAVHQLVGVIPRKVVFHVFTRPTAKAGVTWRSIETRRNMADLREFEAKLKWAVKTARAHSADPESPSLRRPEWEYHKYCQFRDLCTPWELVPKDGVSIR